MAKKKKFDETIDDILLNAENELEMQDFNDLDVSEKNTKIFNEYNNLADDFLAKSKKRMSVNSKMIQSSIYLEANVEILIRLYYKHLNEFLTKKNGLHALTVKKSAITNNILYDFLVTNNLLEKDYNNYADRKQELSEIGEQLLQDVFKTLNLKSLINKNFSFTEKKANGQIVQKRQGIYINFEVLEYICYCSNLIFTVNEGEKTTLVNNILKKWFIENNVCEAEYFSDSFDFSREKDVLHLDNEKIYYNYFSIKNKIINDDNILHDEDK